MEDVPQPSGEPYTPGDEVRVYLDERDADAHHHGTRAVVVDRFEDGLAEETERELDSFSYRLRALDSGELLKVQFRHRDLVPLDG